MTEAKLKDGRVGAGTTWGEHCVFGANVVIGRNCVIGNHVVFHDDVVVGDGVRIDDHAVLGKLPMRAASSATTKDAQFAPQGFRVRLRQGATLVQASEDQLQRVLNAVAQHGRWF